MGTGADSGCLYLAVSVLGLAGAGSYFLRRTPLPLWAQLAPAAGIAVGWVFFSVNSPDGHWSASYPYLAFLVCLSLAGTVGAGFVLGRRGPFHAAFSHFLPCYSAVLLVFGCQGFEAAAECRRAADYALAFTHYGAPEAGIVLGLFLALAGFYPRLPRLTVALFDVAAMALVVLGLADLHLARHMEIRLDWDVLVVASDPVLTWRMIRGPLGSLALEALALAGGYAVLVRWGSRGRVSGVLGLRFNHRLAAGSFLGVYFTMSGIFPRLLVSADKAENNPLVKLAASSPWLRGMAAPRLTPEEFRAAARRLGFEPGFARSARAGEPAPGQRPEPPAPGRREDGTAAGVPRTGHEAGKMASEMNLVLVVLESMHTRYLSWFGAADPTQPLLERYRERCELFPNFYANRPDSLPARFTILSGFYFPSRFDIMYAHMRIAAPSLFEALHAQGYGVSLYDSSHRAYNRWNDYVGHRGLDHFYDAGNMPGREGAPPEAWGVSETVTLKAMRTELARHGQIRDRFALAYFPVTPHLPFAAPAPEFCRFSEAGAGEGDYTGRYKNLLFYMDSILAGLLDELERQRLLEDTLVVITSDHGTLVGEDPGKWGHGWSLDPRLMNVPLVILNPSRRGYRVNATLGSEVDLLPTILDLLGLPLPAGALYQGASLYDEPARRNPVVYLNSGGDCGLIRNGYYCYGDRGGRIGETNALRVLRIVTQDTKTVFEPVSSVSAEAGAPLEEYLRFQDSFIIHYSAYERAFREGIPPK